MSEIGLIDVDKTKFPNLPLMKISAYEKSQGNNVEFVNKLKHYDKVYVSKEFGNEYSTMDDTIIQADEIVYGGTGFAIDVKNGIETFDKCKDIHLPDKIEHIFPDYSLYDTDQAYGFLTRGCPNACGFCHVSPKEGRCSYKVADLGEFYNDNKKINIMDANLLACKERVPLIEQLVKSKSNINFVQGLDARFMDEKVCDAMKGIKVRIWHFAFDQMKNEKQIIKGLELAKKRLPINSKNGVVYVLTNYDTTFEEDMYRIKAIRELGYLAYVMIYRKETAPQITKDLQRWCNNFYISGSCPNFKDYVVRGKTMKDTYGGIVDVN